MTWLANLQLNGNIIILLCCCCRDVNKGHVVLYRVSSLKIKLRWYIAERKVQWSSSLLTEILWWNLIEEGRLVNVMNRFAVVYKNAELC